ncbi:MAG: Clp protease ClpP [Treponema sp.]|nr:Clp protease ClpP [Candidatus Treponema caballi]
MPRKTKRPMWEFKQAAEPDTLEIYIYGDVESDGYDWWWGEKIPSDTSADHFREELTKHPNAKEIKLYINSYGGDVFEGTAIYNQLRRHPAHKTVYVDGFACSIASVIAMAGDKVVMPRNTMMMIHNMWMYAMGNAAELRKAADDLDTINAAGRQAYLQKAGDKLSEDKLIEMMDAETWLTAEDCIELGFADEYAEEDADLSKAGGILELANMNIQQRLELQKNLAAQLKQIFKPADKPEENPKPTEKTNPVNSLIKVLGGNF